MADEWMDALWDKTDELGNKILFECGPLDREATDKLKLSGYETFGLSTTDKAGRYVLKFMAMQREYYEKAFAPAGHGCLE